MFIVPHLSPDAPGLWAELAAQHSAGDRWELEALGIGATSVIFSVINTVILKPLPYRDPQQLVQLWMRFSAHQLPNDQNWVSAPEFRDFLTPEKMRSRGLYAMPGLRRVLAGSDDEWAARGGLIQRIATVEQVCRELRFEPGPELLG